MYILFHNIYKLLEISQWMYIFYIFMPDIMSFRAEQDWLRCCIHELRAVSEKANQHWSRLNCRLANTTVVAIHTKSQRCPSISAAAPSQRLFSEDESCRRCCIIYILQKSSLSSMKLIIVLKIKRKQKKNKKKNLILILLPPPTAVSPASFIWLLA